MEGPRSREIKVYTSINYEELNSLISAINLKV